jgi:hypothetical protein
MGSDEKWLQELKEREDPRIGAQIRMKQAFLRTSKQMLKQKQ